MKELIIPVTVTPESVWLNEILTEEQESIGKITVEKGNRHFSSMNGILYNKDRTELVFYPRAKRRRSYRMPDSVKVVAAGAFTDGMHFNGSLEEVFLSSSLTEIPDNCFRNMNVYSVDIPEGIKRIGKDAFANTNLVCPTLPASLKSLSCTAFSGCCKMHLLNIKDDRFGLNVSMLPRNDDMFVVFETMADIEHSKYPGISVMNIPELEAWIEN